MGITICQQPCCCRKSESRGPRCRVAAHAQGPWIATHAWRACGPRRATGSDGSREACSSGLKSDAISAVCRCNERLLGVDKIGVDQQTQGVTGGCGELRSGLHSCVMKDTEGLRYQRYGGWRGGSGGWRGGLPHLALPCCLARPPAQRHPAPPAARQGPGHLSGREAQDIPAAKTT